MMTPPLSISACPALTVKVPRSTGPPECAVIVHERYQLRQFYNRASIRVASNQRFPREDAEDQANQTEADPVGDDCRALGPDDGQRPEHRWPRKPAKSPAVR